MEPISFISNSDLNLSEFHLCTGQPLEHGLHTRAKTKHTFLLFSKCRHNCHNCTKKIPSSSRNYRTSCTTIMDIISSHTMIFAREKNFLYSQENP